MGAIENSLLIVKERKLQQKRPSIRKNRRGVEARAGLLPRDATGQFTGAVVHERNPYEGLRPEEMIVRDHLALDRTRLANERTLLAYLRSGVALVLAGATLLHFSQSTWLEWVGLACIPIGILTLLFGSWRFTVTARRLRRIS